MLASDRYLKFLVNYWFTAMNDDVVPAQVSARPVGLVPEEKEKDMGTVVNPVDLQFLKEVKKEKAKDAESKGCSAGDIFLAASYVTLLLDLFSSGFTLWCTKHPQPGSLILKVTLAYYGLYLVASAVLVANSVVELKELKERETELEAEQKRVRYLMEYLTAISAALWIVLCCTSMLMAMDIHNAVLQYSSLVISLVAPLMGSAAAFLRMYDAVRAHKKEKALEKSAASEADRARASLRVKARYIRAALYGVIAAFEFLHFIGHIWEAYLLVGNTHRLFYITDELFLVSQVVLGAMFIALAIMESVVENKAERILDANVHELQVEEHAELRPAPADDTDTSLQRQGKVLSGSELSIYDGSVQTVLTDLSDSIEDLSLHGQVRETCCRRRTVSQYR